MEKDEFDELLDEAEKDFFPSNRVTQHPTTELPKKLNTVSAIDDILDELLNDENGEEEVIKHKRSQRDTPFYQANSATKGCDKLRCTSCDFHVIWFDNYRWTDSCDYYFLRNNVPDYSKLQGKLTSIEGYRSYACQCSWKSINEIIQVPGNLKWVCTRHEQ